MKRFNKIHDLDDFRNTSAPRRLELGVPVLGLLPYRSELTHLSLGFLAESLFAKVIAGEKGRDAGRTFGGAVGIRASGGPTARRKGRKGRMPMPLLGMRMQVRRGGDRTRRYRGADGLER